MKRVLVILTLFVILMSFVGCTENKREENTDTVNVTSENTDLIEKESVVNNTPNNTVKPEQKIDFANVEVNNIIKFGKFEQDNDLSNGKEEIDWLVLDKADGKILVISKYALDGRPYNDVEEAVTWETCSIRKWLNETFYDEVFSDDEKSLIPTVTVKAEKNLRYSTDPGNDTQDKVFLLSMDEADRYFRSNHYRMCVATEYARTKPMAVDNIIDTAWWLLRTPGSDQFGAARVKHDGTLYDGGDVTVSDAVRPAMWIEIS